MSEIFAVQLTAVATAVLALFAIVTAWYARRAFLKQSREVAAIERQVADGQDLARQQAELLKVQSNQMELQREQLAAQAAANDIQIDASGQQAEAYARQAEVLELQAAELRESLAGRTRQAEQLRRAQAARVFLTEDPFKGRGGRGMAAYGESIGVDPRPPSVTATAHNTSDQPIYDAELYWRRGSAGHGDPNPEPVGTLLPGATHKSTRDFPPGTNLEVSGAVLHFRDAAGTKWTRRPDGYLGEQL
jgi:hypothetical protein